MKHLIIIGAMALSACGQERPRIVKPPAELQTCADEPRAPVLPVRDGSDAVQLDRDKMTLEFILALRSAWGDCAAKISGVAAWAKGLD